MSQASLKLCDGLGVYRVAHQVFAMTQNVELIDMQMCDMKLLFDWQCEDSSRVFSRQPHKPTWSEHQSWYTQSLAEPARRMWKIRFSNIDCGYIRLDQTDQQEEVSILLSNEYRGLGLASAALNKLKSRTKNVLAYVHPDNIASHKLFVRAGFKKIALDAYQWEAS